MKYYLIAGEPSGDLHGANLIRGLQKADPGAEFRFWGGDCMAAAGGAENQRKHYRETSFFGIVQVLKNLGTIRRQMRECAARSNRKGVILISLLTPENPSDSPDHHLSEAENTGYCPQQNNILSVLSHNRSHDLPPHSLPLQTPVP